MPLRAAHPRLPVHLRHPHDAPAGKDRDQVLEMARRSVARARRVLRRRRVQPDGRHALRPELRLRDARGGASTPARRRSTSRTPSATRRRRSSRRSSAASSRTSATSTRRGSLSHCHNDLGLAVANSLAAVQARRPPGRSLRSTASASAPATPRSRRWSWRCETRSDFYRASRPTSIRRRSTAPAGWSRADRA